MRRASIIIAACAVLVVSVGADQDSGRLAIAPDVVDLRGLWKDNGLDRLKARAKGLDPDQIRMPRKIKEPPPDPREAIRSGVDGSVTIDCIIDTAGEPEDCRVVSGPRELRQWALKAVRAWRWEPLRIAGTPRKAVVQVEMSFSRRDPV